MFAIFSLGMLAYFASGIFGILNGEQQTSSSVVDGKISHGWGRMPYFILYAQPGNTGKIGKVNVFADGMVDPRGQGYTWHWANSTSLAPSEFAEARISEDGMWALVNITALMPDFNKPGFLTNTAPCLSMVVVNDRVRNEHSSLDIFVIDPATPASQLVAPFTHLDPNSVQHADGFWQPALDNYGAAQNAKYTLEKRKVPLGGAFWGLPSEGDHTHEQFSMPVIDNKGIVYNSWTANQGCRTHKCTKIDVTLSNPLVDVVAPISIKAQVLHLVASFGGFIATFSTIFYLVFVRKYPPSEGEKISTELTLFGCASKARCSKAEHKESFSSLLLPLAETAV